MLTFLVTGKPKFKRAASTEGLILYHPLAVRRGKRLWGTFVRKGKIRKRGKEKEEVARPTPFLGAILV